ncbi:hypothetical protein [Salinispora arenicola]|uniref:hypothetical protein n=1 Tax=Salinispora arenicola TaxID=168697 RepID=UPI001E54DB0B|nr:hypothetical protein [Salinispora arenicola]
MPRRTCVLSPADRKVQGEPFSSRVIIPVGFSLGPQYRYVRPGDPTPESWGVRLGDDWQELNEAEARVYSAAFSEVGCRAQMRAWAVRLFRAARRPQPDTQRLVDHLIARGLLLAFDPEGPLEDLFRRYRLFPTAEGMGSTADRPQDHWIGHGNRRRMAVLNNSYVMWAYSSLHSSLWEACKYYAGADEEEREPGEYPLGLTAESVAREVAGNLPMMVATRCAFLDPIISS